MSIANTKNKAVQLNVGRPAGKKNSSIRADRMEVIQKVAEKLITGMALASSSELAKAIWPDVIQDKTALNAKSKTVRLVLKNITDSPELAEVSQKALQVALAQRAGLKRDPMDIEKEKETKEAARQSRLELQKKDWLSQPIRLMESRIKAVANEALGVYIGEGVVQSSPLPSFNAQVASNTFTRESALRVLELELKIQLHTALRYTWDGEEAWEFYQKAKELVKVKKKLFNAMSLSREEVSVLNYRLKQLRDEVEQAYEEMNTRKGWSDPDLAASQQLSSSELKHMVIESHTDEVETWAAEKLPAEVQISKDLRYPDADKPWDKEPLQQLTPNAKKVLHTVVPIEESTIKRDIANTISGSSLRIAGIAKESHPKNHDFFSTEDLEYLCTFYDQGIKEVAKTLKRSVGSVAKKYHWLERLKLVDYYKERFLQKEKAPAEGQRKNSSTL